jgi:serine/threonine-protein kinase HipA
VAERALVSVAPYFKLSRARTKEILARVERAVAGWRKEGRSLGMTAAELDAFVPAFEHAERKEARRA